MTKIAEKNVVKNEELEKKFEVRRYIAILMTLILVFAVSGCGNSDVPKVNETSNEGNASSEQASGDESSTKEDVRTEFYINEYVELKDVVIKVNKVFDTEIKSEFLGPKEGLIRKSVNLTIYNTGDKQYNLSNIFAFELIDNEGYNYSPNLASESNTEMSGVLPAGGMITGDVSFDITKGGEPAELLFDYSLFNSSQIVFKLDKSLAVAESEFSNPKVVNAIAMGTVMNDSELPVTVNSVRQSSTLSMFETDDSAEWSYAILDVTVENKSSETKIFSTLGSFTLVDQEGNFYPVSLYADGLKGDVGGDIAPGRTNRGEVAFKVKKGMTLDYVIYSPILGIRDSLMTKIDLVIE